MISIQYSEDPKKRKAQRIALWTVAGLAGAVVFGLLFGFLIQVLWNATIADIFGLPALSFWQAVGLFILAKLFFGFGSGTSRSRGRRKKKARDDRDADSEDVATLADDETFRKFWAEEGKESYDAFRQADADDKPEAS